MTGPAREAEFKDIPRICELMTEMHQRSKYSEYRFDIKKFKDLVMGAMRSGRYSLFVVEKSGQVEGFLIGAIDELYPCLKAYYATDLYFYTSEKGSGLGARLLMKFEKWAKSIENVDIIRIGATSSVTDFKRTGKMFEKRGFIQEGVIHEKRLKP